MKHPTSSDFTFDVNVILGEAGNFGAFAQAYGRDGALLTISEHGTGRTIESAVTNAVRKAAVTAVARTQRFAQVNGRNHHG